MGEKSMIYADNAATTRLDIDVFEAMRPFLLDQYANASQPYSFSRSVKQALKEARESIATCINATPEEIFFTSGGTESDNWAIKCSLEYGDNQKVITSEFEHHAVLHACRRMEQTGVPVRYVHPTKDGFVTAQALKSIIDDKTKLVSIMMVNNEIGTIQPIKELCTVAHDHGALFHTDAVQALGHIPVDVQELNVDLLSCSAHKFNGPKGTGFLYVKSGTPLRVYADGGAQEYGMRAGTENVASIVGMATALKKNVERISESEKKLKMLECALLKHLQESEIKFLRNGTEPRIPGNMSLSFPLIEGEMLLHRLDLMGIMVSTGSACDSKNTQTSHVLKAIEVDDRYARGTIRISLGRENTIEEALKIADALIKILKRH